MPEILDGTSGTSTHIIHRIKAAIWTSTRGSTVPGYIVRGTSGTYVILGADLTVGYCAQVAVVII